MAEFPTSRLRRLRSSAPIRELVATVRLSRDDLVAPLFVHAGADRRREIASMPGQYQLSVDEAVATVRRLAEKGLRGVLLFGLPQTKDARGTGAWDEEGPVQRLCRELKGQYPQMAIFADTCLCEYTDHGHCGPVVQRADGSAMVDNDAALEGLQKVALSLAAAGADFVAPSAMMDGQVRAIRAALDQNGFVETGVLAYSVKFASSLYGPFRQAAGSAPSFGDRRTYQMDPRNPRQARLEVDADAAEGADILMVKPAATCLDIIADVRRRCDLPLAAYHVSGEYAMLKAAGRLGWIDEAQAVLEVTTAIKRAGADLIITYFAEELAEQLQETAS